MTKEEALQKIKELEEYIKNIDNTGFKDDPIFLLSKEEYERYKDVIPKRRCWWWLRSPGDNSGLAAVVYDDGEVGDYGHGVRSDDGGIRPVIKIETLGNVIKANGNIYRLVKPVKIGDTFSYRTFSFTVIDEDLAIATVPISFDKFDDKSNDYENSYIRKWLIEWCGVRK